MSRSSETHSEEEEEEDGKLPAMMPDVDDDNWSRQVETDEVTIAGLMESFLAGSIAQGGEKGSGHNKEDDNDSDSHLTDHADGVLVPPPPPNHRELSMKERLVLRERQRRIETERARLKRQFALNNANGDELAGGALSEAELGENASVADESTRAYPDDDSNEEKLGFNMERFLGNQSNASFNPQLEATAEEHVGDQMPGGVVMERFINEPVQTDVLDHSEHQEMHTISGAQRSVSFDGEDNIRRNIPSESFISYGDDTRGSTNASVQVEADDDDLEDPLLLASIASNTRRSHSDNSHSTDSTAPRVLRLTEADMQEMANIDEASIGNAPPSDRDEDEISEIGELAHFGRDPIEHESGLDTPSTAQESASILSGEHRTSLPSLTNFHPASQTSSDHDHAILDNESDTLMVDGVSDDSANSMNETHPPSVVARDETEGGMMDDPMALTRDDEEDETKESMMNESYLPPSMALYDDERDEGIVNRTLRPGMVHIQPHLTSQSPQSRSTPIPSHAADTVIVHDFDFDKYVPSSPVGNIIRSDDSYHDLPWSPEGHMQVSPMIQKRTTGSFLGNGLDINADSRANNATETTALLGNDVPPDIIIRRSHSDQDMTPNIFGSVSGCNPRQTLRSAVDSVFSGIRSEDESIKEEITNDCEVYLHSTMLAKAFPERLSALTVTLILEIPVLLMISGGSDQLCKLIGRSQYQLLVGFLPLTSAISGNVGLQASTLTTRAISHRHVTPKSWWNWLVHEVGTACLLGAGMGVLMGSIGYFASGMDFAFGLTIFTAQLISIVTAGITGTFAPLLFSFIFKRDSGKWGGPLETAIQDIIGSFAMIVISYQLLKFFGTRDVAPDDVCGGEDLDG